MGVELIFSESLDLQVLIFHIFKTSTIFFSFDSE